MGNVGNSQHFITQTLICELLHFYVWKKPQERVDCKAFMRALLESLTSIANVGERYLIKRSTELFRLPAMKNELNELGMATINDVCDYIILMCCSGAETLNLLKLQKLLYYVQAWSLAFDRKPLFNGKFEAWIHGPVNREIFVRFAGQKTLYSAVDSTDIRPGFNPETAISRDDKLHIDNVLEVYAKFSGSELEAQAHIEEPWIRARGDCGSTSRCETVLDEQFMGDYYRERLSKA